VARFLRAGRNAEPPMSPGRRRWSAAADGGSGADSAPSRRARSKAKAKIAVIRRRVGGATVARYWPLALAPVEE